MVKILILNDVAKLKFLPKKSKLLFSARQAWILFDFEVHLH